jgi:cytochrome c oxidase subunit 2
MKYSINRRRALAGLVAAGSVGLLTAAGSAPPKQKVIKVTTKRFEFNPSVITLRKGEPVTLEFTALDIPMGFKLPDFGMRTDVIPGKTTRLRLTPAKAGTFVFLCDVFCGSGHEDMSGKLVVME